MHVKLLQSCPTLCDPMDCSLLDSSVHGSGLPVTSPEDIPDPGIEPLSLMSAALQMDPLATEPSRVTGNSGDWTC